MDALSITQTIFYAIASIVLIVLGGILVAVSLRMLGVLKDAREVSKGIKLFYTKIARTASKFFGSAKNKQK